MFFKELLRTLTARGSYGQETFSAEVAQGLEISLNPKLITGVSKRRPRWRCLTADLMRHVNFGGLFIHSSATVIRWTAARVRKFSWKVNQVVSEELWNIWGISEDSVIPISRRTGRCKVIKTSSTSTYRGTGFGFTPLPGCKSGTELNAFFLKEPELMWDKEKAHLSLKQAQLWQPVLFKQPWGAE